MIFKTRSQLFADLRQGLALRVGQAYAALDLVAQHAVLCDYVFKAQQKLLVD
jgi:hypothetical protein